MPIIIKCHDSIQAAMDAIVPDKDTTVVIEKFKSGDVPPGDFNFEDMQDPHSMLSADALASNGPTNLNLYPRKKELERQMASTEAELSKSQKELFSLNQMMETYQNQPKFGNSKNFQKEIQRLHAKNTDLEATLTSIRAEHVAVEERLEALRSRSSPMTSNGGRLNRGGSTNSSGGSIKSSSLSIASSSRVYDMPRPGASSSASDDYDEIPPPPPDTSRLISGSGLTSGSTSGSGSDTMSSLSSPSVSSSSSTDGSGSGNAARRCVALYTYNNANMEESNIPMEQGEEFIVVDEDCDGWTRVRRVVPNPDFGDEGFVPTTWIQTI